MSDPAYPHAEPPPQYEPPKDPYAAGGAVPPGPPGAPMPPVGYAPPPAGYPQQPPPQPYPIQQPPPMGYTQAQYPQQPGHPQYPMGQPGTHTTTIMMPPVTAVMAPLRFGEAPVIMQCPHCQSQITTATSFKIGMFTWMVVGIMALVGLFFFPPLWLCCCIPCCIPSCKDVDHSCPNCNKFVGHYARLT